MFISGSAMLWGGAKELNPGLGPPASRKFSSRGLETSLGTQMPASAQVLTPGLLPQAGARSVLRRGPRRVGCCFLGAKSEAQGMSLFWAPLGIKVP